MSNFSVNIANIVLTNEQYYKLKFYANSHHVSLQKSIILLIDSLPRPSKNSKILKNRYSMLSARNFLQRFDNIQN